MSFSEEDVTSVLGVKEESEEEEMIVTVKEEEHEVFFIKYEEESVAKFKESDVPVKEEEGDLPVNREDVTAKEEDILVTVKGEKNAFLKDSDVFGLKVESEEENMETMLVTVEDKHEGNMEEIEDLIHTSTTQSFGPQTRTPAASRGEAARRPAVFQGASLPNKPAIATILTVSFQEGQSEVTPSTSGGEAGSSTQGGGTDTPAVTQGGAPLLHPKLTSGGHGPNT
ncbi:uncharacterized protein LOC105031046 isoform X4 [Esox lucius]|uniref:uncharacterized protein LOC105031046 isoform X4 n=1 Tax=Esox lucius TaxID=8010 RepID=UPI001476DE64|nr:uncharacterized protein LOC105031046 isoform X4 [Esox lucius]